MMLRATAAILDHGMETMGYGWQTNKEEGASVPDDRSTYSQPHAAEHIHLSTRQTSTFFGPCYLDFAVICSKTWF